VRGHPPHPEGPRPQLAPLEPPPVVLRRKVPYTEVLVPRSRSARVATLGAPARRPTLPGSPIRPRFGSPVRRRIVATGLVLASLALLSAYFRESDSGPLHGIQSTGAAILRPFEVGAERVARPFRDAANWFSGLVDAKSENAELRRQVDQYGQLLIQNQTAAA